MGRTLDEVYGTNPEKGMKLLISDGGSTATLIELFCKNVVGYETGQSVILKLSM